MNRWLNYIKLIKASLRFLVHRKLRSFLSVLGVICGVMAVLAMLSIGEGAKKEAMEQIEQLGVRNIYAKSVPLSRAERIKARQRLSTGLNADDAQRIESGCPRLEAVACLNEISVSFIGSVSEFSPQVVACTSDYGPILGLNLSIGRFISDLDVAGKKLVCVLGSQVSERLGRQGIPGGYLRIGNHMLQIVGVLDRFYYKSGKSSAIAVRNFNEMVFVPLGVEQMLVDKNSKTALVNMELDGLSEIVVQTNDSNNIIQQAGIISRILEVAHNGVDDYQIVIPKELLRQARETRRTFNIVLGSIAAISLLVGGIGIMNIMLATVSERTKEIGIRRSVGATRSHIVTQFLAEAVFLTASGGILGVAFGIGAVWVITVAAGWATSVTPYAVICPLIMSLLVGLFFGLYPAYKAAQMNPIAALRHE